MGPTNITRSEGEYNVFVPCPLSGLVLPVWNINGYFYDLYQLPEQYTPAYGGIYIQVVSRELNGTKFQCYTLSESGYILAASSVGILTVIFTGIIITQKQYKVVALYHSFSMTGIVPRLPVENSYLYLDHQHMIFDKGNATLAWKPTDVDCSTYKIIFRKECGFLSKPDKTSEIFSPTVTLPFSYVEGETSVDINIQSVNDDDILCQTMKETIQLHKSGI